MPAFAGSSAEPPLADSYYALLRRAGAGGGNGDEQGAARGYTTSTAAAVPPASSANEGAAGGGVVAECELPMIDVGCLTRTDADAAQGSEADERAACAAAIARAAEEWGFFQVRNHGVSQELLDAMRREQARLFRLPFEVKANAGLLNRSYRWGTPTATSPQQLSWSEAFHVPLAGVTGTGAAAGDDDGTCCDFGELTTLRDVTREVAGAMSKLAGTLARVLAEAALVGRGAGEAGERFLSGCDETTCFLRLNRYPACPIDISGSGDGDGDGDALVGLVPHTDSDFLTVLCQDQQVGGLQLMKGARWVAVKPIPGALIVNIGDLFQAWSNNRYKSVEHKVMTNAKMERYSVAYFLCPSYDSPIGTCEEPSLYRAFTFGEYRRKVQEDVKRTGKKVGLPNFLV